MTDILRMRIVDANPRPKIEGLNELPGRSNYFIGRDRTKWLTGIRTYSRVRYERLYRGIDLSFYGNQRRLEYDFEISPGADPRRIAFSFNGADDVSIDAATGDLVLRIGGDEVRQLKPIAYQEVNGERRVIAANYILTGDRQISFDVPSYDPTKVLVIDPVLVYSTYLGGSSSDTGSGIALDPSGNAYVAGYTSSSNFPTLNSIHAYPGNQSGFITKINSSGTALVYSTYLGGTGNGNTTNLFDIAVDSAGNAYATGLTFATDYPTTSNALQPTKPVPSSANTAVVTRLSPGGNLSYSTYLGSSQASRGFGIATDGAGNAYVVGSPATGFPTTASAFNSTQPSTGFLTKLDTNASGQASLAYSTFLGPAFGGSTPTTIAVDAAGNAYLAGNATSGSNNTGFTTAGAFQTTYGGGTRDVFVAKFNTNASGNASRVYCTYLGGSGDDFFGEFTIDASKAIAIDAGGNAYVTARTSSTNFPVMNAFQATKGGTTTNAFLTKLNPTGSALVYSTYFGGSNTTTPGDGGLGVAVNVVGNAYITGFANSADFPTANPIVPVQANGGVFVAKFTPTGNALVYSTRLSGSGEQHYGHGVALDSAGNAFVTGNVRAGFPTTAGSFQTTLGGLDDAFISQIADPTIIGRVVDESNNGIPGAAVNLSGVPSGTTTTDADGYYTFGLLTVGNNYTVSVSVANYIFNSQIVNNLQKNVRLDFSPVVVTISGQVTLGGGGLDATTMTLSGGKSLTTQTNASGNYSFANLPAGRNYTVTPSKPSFGFVPTSASFTNVLVNQTANFIAQATVQFNVGSYVANEADGKATITITRTSGASGPASVRYAMSDGTAKQKSDYILAFGTLRKAAGETSKSFQVLIVDDVYVEGDESLFVALSDAVGATIGTPNPAQVFITDNDTVPPTSNPIDQSRFFVQEHYYDFLSRYPDPSGWDFWTNNIDNCTPKPSCTGLRLIDTSAAYFLSIEFQQTGYLVERIHKSAFGDASGASTLGGAHQLAVPTVRFPDFISDTEEIGDGLVVGQSGWETVLENNKQAFTSDFVQRTRFTTAFPTTMTPTQFVDRLNTNAGNVLSASDRANAIALFGSATDTTNVTARAQALRQVAENQNLATAEFNRAFVLMQFFGYLRRNPNDLPDSDYTGYEFWLNKLNQFNGNYNAAEMVKAFIVSSEYRQRFGP